VCLPSSRARMRFITGVNLPVDSSVTASNGLAWILRKVRLHRNGRSQLPEARLLGAGLPEMRQTVQLGRPRRNSMSAALTSAGRSCWVQCPQPGSIWMSRSKGTACFMLAICSAAPGNATTMS
jgi:hypothetical protein